MNRHNTEKSSSGVKLGLDFFPYKIIYPLYKNLYEGDLLERCANKIHRSKSLRKRKISKGIDKITISSYFKNPSSIPDLRDTLKRKTFHFSSLKGFALKKEESNKDRLITVPIIEDRVVQKTILAIINPILFPYVDTGVSFCGVKKDVLKRNKNGLNTAKAIRNLIDAVEDKKFWIYKADIKEFFDKVPKDKLLDKVKEKLMPDTSLIPLLKEIIYYELGNANKLETNPRIELPTPEIGVSQGSSLSPLFANLYLADFDLDLIQRYGKTFIRYVDDLLFFAKTEEKIIEIKKYVEKYLEKIDLEVSDKKGKAYICNLKKDRLDFLGLKITREGITEKDYPTIAKYINQEIFNFKSKEYQYLETWEKKLERMNMRLQGIYNYYRYYHTEKLHGSINYLIRNQKKRFKKQYQSLQELPARKTEPIIPLTEWRSLFSSKT